MNKFTASLLSLLLAASFCIADPSARAHASREAAIQLLRREHIMDSNTRVTDATWSGTFWIISLRHQDGHTTNWTVDAAAKDYSYICWR